MDFDNKVLTAMIVVNSLINVMILYLVAPMYQIKGTLKQALTTLGHHEKRLLSLEERSNGR
jgi:cell division protein FtsL